MASDWPRTFFTARLFLFSIHSYIAHSCNLTVSLTIVSIIEHNRKESEHNRGIFGQKHFRKIFEHN